MRCLALLSALFLFITTTSHSQNFVNPSFENNFADSEACTENLINEDFNELMPGVTAFGAGNQCDILIEGCDMPAPTHGTFAIGLATKASGDVDAVSMEIETPLIAGNMYELTFDGFGNISHTDNEGLVYLGLSEINSDPASVPIGEYLMVPDTWATFSQVFEAPNNSEYLTITLEVTGAGFWLQFDNFSLSTVLSTETFKNQKRISVVPNPAQNSITIPENIEVLEYTIYGVSGNTILAGQVTGIQEIDITPLSQGMYFILLNERQIGSFVKQ